MGVKGECGSCTQSFDGADAVAKWWPLFRSYRDGIFVVDRVR